MWHRKVIHSINFPQRWETLIIKTTFTWYER
nr:MAG TPA: hypothetical protein [Bacteriophage sp.]